MVSEQAIWTHNRKLFGKQNNRKYNILHSLGSHQIGLIIVLHAQSHSEHKQQEKLYVNKYVCKMAVVCRAADRFPMVMLA